MNKKALSLCLILISSLLILVSNLISSFRECLNNNVKYHVQIQTANFNITNYSSIKKLKKENNLIEIKYTNPKYTIKNTKKICSKIKCQKIKYNDKLLIMYGHIKSQSLKQVLKMFTLIILISIFIIIKSIFQIDINIRKKNYGILKSIGMSKCQMLKQMLNSNMKALSKSLLIGFAISYIISLLLIEVINYLMKDANIELKLILNISNIIIINIYIIIIIIVLNLKNFINIYHTPTMDLLKEKDRYKYKKTPKIMFFLKPTHKFIYQNYQRDKKKYKPILFCTFICTFIFSFYGLYMAYTEKIISKNMPSYDGIISIKGDNRQYLTKLANKNNIKKYSLFRNCQSNISLPKNNYQHYYSKQKNLIIISNNQEKVINIINNKKYLKEFTINNKKIKLEQKVPWGINWFMNPNNIVYMTPNINKLCDNYNTTLIYQGYINKKQIKDGSYYIDFQKANEITAKVLLSVKIIMYTLIILITIISIIITITINKALLRSRISEYKLLKTIGLETKKQINITTIEYILLITKSFILNIIILTIINNYIYDEILINYTSKIYFYKELIISFLISYLVIYITIDSHFDKQL